MVRTLIPGHWEALGFSRLFEVRVFKTTGKAACGIGHLESPALSKLRPEAFCEFRDNQDYMLSPVSKTNSTWEDSLAGKVFSHNCENLHLIPRTHIKKLGMVVHASNPSDGEVDPWDSLPSQTSLVSQTNLVSFQARGRETHKTRGMVR